MAQKLLILIALIKNVCSKMEPFVVSGEDTNIYKYPHTVLLYLSCNEQYICGGSILNQYVVLSAAHCFEDCKDRASVVVKYGHQDINRMQGSTLKAYKLHEEYHTQELWNDIALALCRHPLSLGKVAKRVAILKSPVINVGDAYVAGFGVMNEYKVLPDTLQETVQRIQTSRVCKKLGTLPRGTFCAAPPSGHGVPAEGDSGSALITKKYIQLGLVSYKEGKNTLVVYTNVTYHRNWIKENAAKLFCSMG